MKVFLKKNPRKFYPRGDKKIKIIDMGDIELSPDEQITFIKKSGARIDFVSKSWGYYATPSINRRLKNENFKTAIVKNSSNNIYIMVVEISKLDLFINYCKAENQDILEWLDER